MDDSRVVIYGLYCTCHPDAGIRYVGQTRKGMKARLQVHRAHSRTMKWPVCSWIKKHGEQNVTYDILEVCEPDHLDDREEYWIAHYRQIQGNRLLNVKNGGSTTSGHKRPAQSERMRGERNPMWGKDRKELMDYARSFTKPMSEERRERVRQQMLGRNHSEGSKLKMSTSAKASWTIERHEAASAAAAGEGNRRAKLTEADVREIRRLHEEQGLGYRAISRLFPVSDGNIAQICKRRTWKHVE